MRPGKKILTYVVIFLTAWLSALSYILFVFPNNFAPAGINGLCTMIQYALGIRVSIMNLLVNLPLALLVYKIVSRPVAIRSMIYSASFSLALAVLEHVPLEQFAYATENGTSTILGPLVAGIINGFCYSVVLRSGSNTGGLDYVAALIHSKLPEFHFLTLTFLMNCVVAGISYFVYGYQIEPVILCILYCFLSSNVSDRILRSGKAAIKFEMYSGAATSILLCVINKGQLVEFENIIHRYPGTFAYLSQVKEVVGNFKHINKNGQQENRLLDDGSDGTL